MVYVGSPIASSPQTSRWALVLLLFAYLLPLAIHLPVRSPLWAVIRVLQVNFLRLLSLRGLPQLELTS